MWLVSAFMSALFAGITSILAKLGLRTVNSNLVTALRTIVVLAFAWLLVWQTGAHRGIAAIGGRSAVFLLLSGLSTGGSWLMYYRALSLAEVNRVAPIDKSSTILAMLFGFAFLGESLTWLRVLAMIMMASGSYLMVAKPQQRPLPAADSPSEAGAADDRGSWRWLFFAAGSAVFAALTSVFGKVGMEGINSNLGTALRTIVVAILAWLIVLGRGETRGIRHIGPRDALFIGLSGLTTGASWLFYYYALQNGPVSVVQPIDKLSILVTVVFSFFLLGERLSRRGLIGLGLLVVGTLSLLL